MFVCEGCFNDGEIQSAIHSASTQNGICPVCGQLSNLIDIDYFSDFFSELLSLFEVNSVGKPIPDILQEDWQLFSSNQVGWVILDYFIQKNHTGYALTDNVSYISSIEDSFKRWEDLKESVRKRFRFFANISFISNVINPNATIPSGRILYRARIIPYGRKYLQRKEMGCPPIEKATAGRANPLGIPYLYLCNDEVTTYYEVRSVYLDKISVGEFIVERDLNILDFTSKISLFDAFNNATDSLYEIIAKYKLLQLISNDLSKPLRRFDTELEYIPTQLLCEYCRLQKIDGIRFFSSLHKSGVNIVLFDTSSAKCINVKSRIIKRVEIYR